MCSGIELETAHRQHLHELILGAQGVTLNVALQTQVAAVEEHNRRLKSLPEAIPSIVRGRFTVEAFCAIEPKADIEEAIIESERALAAAKAADTVRARPAFQPVDLPRFDKDAIAAVLHTDMPELEAAAAARVQGHLALIGKGGETWVADGMPRIIQASEGTGENCPFCAQDLKSSSLIAHYQAFFSQGYADLRSAIITQEQAISRAHGGDVPAAFEREVLVATQAHEFWAAFTAVPPVLMNTLDVARSWKGAREGVLAALRTKHAQPLERQALSPDVHAAIDSYHAHHQQITAASAALVAANDAIDLVKEQTASANVVTLEADLANLRSIKARHTPQVDAACRAYLNEKAAKTRTEQTRDQARAALDRYRTVIFPTYEQAINDYLRRFGASFRLGNVASVNNRGGSSCTYSVVINDVPVSVTAANGPSFRNTLSAGDRNTLALAFFFASLEQDAANIIRKIVVIDDPMTSLDEHRNRNTLHEMRQLLVRVDQMIVLSHSKPFLCPLWENAAAAVRSAFRIDRVRDGQNQDASSISSWNVHDDCVSENDRRHEQLQLYLANGDPALERAVATSLRPILEQFMRVAYSPFFPPGTMFGAFLTSCERQKGTPNAILNAADITQLRHILDYANEFHHDTNPAYQTTLINGQELTDFCRKTVAFARRS